jgi:glycosyltransferase involved in cell wall biosynthesis
MRIALATDAWFPQVNGVVRTLAATVAELDRRGYEVELITPARFMTLPMPGYNSIRLAVAPRFGARRILNQFRPDIVHIAAEGPIGWSARSWCKAHRVPFTSAFHTRFPDYAAVRTGVSAERFWPVMQRFHAPSRAVLAATETLAEELTARGIERVRPWSRGIDRWLFRPDHKPHPAMVDLPRPILLNVGRIAAEKNLEAFLDLDTPGVKVVIGDGPDRARLEAAYPSAVFLGSLGGEELASAYCAADCFVFPSRTDTFGLVVIEALACGLPVAAYPVAGPLDIVGRSGRGPAADFAATIGVLDEDLRLAIDRALQLDRVAAAVYGARFSWEAATDQFLAALAGAVEQPDTAPGIAVTDLPELTPA